MATATRAGRAGRAGAATGAAAKTRKSDEESDEQWGQSFTVMWIDLLENHGQALEVVNQLAAQVGKSAASASTGYLDGYRNGGEKDGDLSGVFDVENGFEKQNPITSESVATLQESMQNMSHLLSSVEEVIRERLLGNGAKASTSAKNEDVDTETTTSSVERSSASTSNGRNSKQQTQNSLDAYLDGVAIEDEDPVFVNSVRGWSATDAPIQTKAYAPEVILLDGLELHDVMMQNNLRIAGIHSANRAYAASGRVQAHTPTNTQSTHHLSSSKNTHTPKSKSADSSEKRTKKRRLSAATSSVSHLSEERQQQQQHPESLSKLTRQHVKNKIAGLTADKILRYRDGAHLCSYLIKWVELEEPIWVLRKQCAPQAQQLIDDFNKKRIAKTRRINRQRAEDAAELRELFGGTVDGADDDDDDDDIGIAASLEDDIFIVDKIVDHRIRYGKKQYLVKWDGYESSDNTWEAATKLQDDVADVVDAYERKVALARKQRGATGSSGGPKIDNSNNSASSNGKAKRQHHSAGDNEKRKRKHRVVMVKSAQRFAAESDEDVTCVDLRSDDDENSTIDLENEVVVTDGMDSDDSN